MIDKLSINNPQPLSNYTISKSLSVLVLAPHPDDFDAIGVSMRFLFENGNLIHLAVATSGASGVEDSFYTPATKGNKTRVREQEQRESCGFFGLPENQLEFLRLDVDKAGHPKENQANTQIIRDCFSRLSPIMVFMPHANDTNAGHRRVYRMLQNVLPEIEYPMAVFLNRDPKTVNMRGDVYMGYGDELAEWKGELLRFHRSQQQRNLNQRGYGLDDRIINLDRENALMCSVNAPYAEVFEIELFGENEIVDILE